MLKSLGWMIIAAHLVACCGFREHRDVPFIPLQRDSSEAQIDKLVAEVSSLKSQLSSALHMVEDTQEKSRRAESQCKMVINLFAEVR